MKKGLLFTLFGTIIGLLNFVSCSSEYSGYELSQTGLYYKFHIHNDTLKPQLGDEMTLRLKYGTKDSTIWNSNSMPDSFTQILYKSDFAGDTYEALSMMAIGDSASFIIQADSFLLLTAGLPFLPEFVEENSKLYFDFKLLNIKSKSIVEKEASEKEIKQIEDYLEKNKQNIEPENNGIYYIINAGGEGKTIEKGQVAQLNFTLKSLDDRMIYTTLDQETLDYELGAKLESDKDKFNAYTKGLDFVIGNMKEGSRVSFISTSELGYGKEWQENIPPFTPLLYHIELLAIWDKAEYEKEKARIAEIKNKAEKTKIQTYLSENNMTLSLSENGLYYIETKKGEGGKPFSGDKVKVHYTLYTLEGKKLDSSYD
ncbi:FKBP-type peptidyl-prolyl cis-trans isomerase, partial [Ancylomarina sp.]|uniref:FKBP-type peptidyl-prolyl cis-trans isomerase n=1 Tax=Ancylomarina sp. TaxID=1970196 RepID=UPI003568EF9F